MEIQPQVQPQAPPVALPAVEQAIPAVVAAVKEVRALKPGYKTTEFWLTIVFNVITGVVVLLPQDSLSAKVGGLVAAAFTILGYSASRGIAKSSQ